MLAGGSMMKTLNGTVAALVVLTKSTRPITPQAVDSIIDPYLIKLGKLTNEVRGELAEAFIRKAPPSDRSAQIEQRILMPSR
jgi:hypothetical protein